MSELPSPTLYRVLAAPHSQGGKLVAVFPDADGDLQGRASRAGAPLSVFLARLDEAGAQLRVFTPTREKGESDSGALAALSWLHGAGLIPDLTTVRMNGQEFPAQLCGGEWLLLQGDASARPAGLTAAEAAGLLGLSPAALGPQPLLIAEAGRPNLLLNMRDAAALDTLAPDLEAVSRLNRRTGTLGLVLYAVPGRGNEDADFRAFGPLKGFGEDNASANTAACLLAGLGSLGLLDPGEALFRLGQGHAIGLPSRLTLQASLHGSGAAGVWVGGSAEQLPAPARP